MIAPLFDRYAVVDIHTALYDGLVPWLLLFDKVTVPGLPGIRSVFNDIDYYNPLLHERAWQRPEVVRLKMLKRLGPSISAAEETIRRLLYDCDFLISRKVMEAPPVQNEYWEYALDFDEERFRNVLDLRSKAAHLYMASGPLALTAVPETFDRTTVVQYIIRQLPVPRNDVPLEEIVAFRTENDNRQKLNRFRVWLDAQTKGVESLAELEVNLLAALEDYRDGIALLDKKYRTSTLSVTAGVATEFADSLFSLKWGSAVKAIFDFRKDRIDWNIEEKGLPGRELAYLLALEQAFPKKADE